MNTVNGGEICTRVALRPALNIFLHMRASTVLIIDFWFVVHFFAYNTYNSAGKYFWKIDSALDIFLRASAQFSSFLNKVQAAAFTHSIALVCIIISDIITGLSIACKIIPSTRIPQLVIGMSNAV